MHCEESKNTNKITKAAEIIHTKPWVKKCFIEKDLINLRRYREGFSNDQKMKGKG